MKDKTQVQAGTSPAAKLGAGHTPGPWKIETLGSCLRVTKSEHEHTNDDIAVLGDCRDAQQQANANLIAAAPELLEACQMLLLLANGFTQWTNFLDPKRIARAAIARATERQS